MREVFRTGEPASFEAWFSPLNRWFDVRAYRLGDHRLAVLSSDITDRKRNEDALRRREAELRSITSNIPDVIARFDRELRHVFVNSTVTSATGLPAEAFIGKTNREMNMPLALCDKWDAALAKTFKSGTQTLSFSLDSSAIIQNIGETPCIRDPVFRN